MNPRDFDFTKLIQEHHSSLRYFIHSLGVNAAWVDDVAQDAFLIAYRKWPSLDGDLENPGAWLRSIARNVVQNELAKQNRRKRLMDENLTTLLLQAGDTAPQSSAGVLVDRKEALSACISKLSERARKILESRYVNDLNSGEIGSEFDMKPAAVRKLLFHARQTLANCLKQTLSRTA